MKINSDTDTVVERTGLASDGAFTIQFNAKMAKILSDGLYSDKIVSIIRELSCNAIDSHVESGKPNVPIEVHLPTIFEPFFHVRDTGIGMDHHGVLNTFTSYGASTKTKSNEFIGQLGLGSKSPFSYVDAFDVTAIKNGVERQYSMYKNEQGIPSVALLGEKQTSALNGVTVKMPVKQEDMRRFSEKAANVFRWFSVRPKVIGVESLEIRDLVPMFEGDGWKICKKNDSYYAPNGINRPVALMGRVAYPLDANALPDLTRAQSAMMGLPLVLEFNIGELEVAASREALGYDKRTQENIKTKLNLLITELAVEFEKKIDSATTEWEARKMFGEIFGQESGFRYEFERAYGNHGLKWKNTIIKDPNVTVSLKDLWDVATNPYPGLYTNNARYNRARHRTQYDDLVIRCNDRSVFVFNDTEKSGVSRLNYAIENDLKSNEYFYFEPSTKKTVQEILNMLGNPPHVMASSLPKRPSVARGTKVNFLKYDGSGDRQNAWTPVDITLEDGGIYVLLDRWAVLRDDVAVNDIEYIVHRARDLGILSKDDVIHAPRGHYRSKIVSQDGWTNLWDLVRAEVNKRMTPKTLQAVADSAHYLSLTNIYLRDSTLWRTNWNLEHPAQPFGMFVSAMRELEKISASSNKDTLLIELANAFGNQVQTAQPSTNVNVLYQHVMEHYPMISFVFADRYSSRCISGPDSVVKIRNYINMVDAAAVRRMEKTMSALDPIMAQMITA